MSEPTPLPETFTFEGDIIALQEWGQATLEHYEKPAGGLVTIYDGQDAGLVYSDWQEEKDPLAWPRHEQPVVSVVGPINQGDTVTFDEKAGFGMRPSPVKADQLHLDGMALKWDAGFDIPDPFDELDKVESMANHPTSRATRLGIATHGGPSAQASLHRS